MKEDTKIGEVSKIEGSTITAVLDDDLAGATPIYEGRIRQISQIGSFLRIPRGMLDLVAVVSQVGVSEPSESESVEFDWKKGKWWLTVELVGQIQKGAQDGSGKFERGVDTYPEIGNTIHFIESKDLAAIFPSNKYHVKLGNLSTNNNVSVTLNIEDLVTKHSAIFGSTGSGKTSTVASLLQNLANQGFQNSNIILIDPHGEYADSLEGASVMSINPSDDKKQLNVPYWALEPKLLLQVMLDAKVAGKLPNRFSQLVEDRRKMFAEKADWLDIPKSDISADSPIPYNLRKVWYTLALENRETVDEDQFPCFVDGGDWRNLDPPEFEQYKMGGNLPKQGNQYGDYKTQPENMKRAMKDPRLQFLRYPEPDLHENPLIEVVHQWLGNENPVSILDISDAPDSAAQAAVALILDILFELSVKGKQIEEGVGRESPVLCILEEAHRYIGSDEVANSAVNQIAKEGRKYGVGLMLVTQRPAEIPSTTLSQCGTMVSLRLTNRDDQGTVKAALPDASVGMSNAISSLKNHEAVVSGEAVTLPSRVLVDDPNPPPDADDPSLDSWLEESSITTVENNINQWYERYS